MRRPTKVHSDPAGFRGVVVDDEEDDSEDDTFLFRQESAAIVRNIASFMTLSDANSLASLVDEVTPADSWVVGADADASWSLATPPTPGLVAVSPGSTPALLNSAIYVRDELSDEDSVDMEQLLQERRRKWAQAKLAAAVFSHPMSLRSFCLEAYSKAKQIRQQQHFHASKDDVDPETWVEPYKTKRKRPKKEIPLLFVHDLVDFIFQNVPLSVLLDVLEGLGAITLDTTYASFQISINTINGTISALGHILRVVWDAITNFNPFALLEAIVSLQFNAMGRTSEVLVSGIQSVATGVESASSLALHRLSAANLSLSVNSNTSVGGATRRGSHAFNRKLLKKISAINDAAPVVSYTESADDTGGLTRHAMTRTRRMMHYSVSLRPFVATVKVRSPVMGGDPNNIKRERFYSSASTQGGSSSTLFSSDDLSIVSTSPNNRGSPIICSPQSFPPTPRSRQMVLARGSQFADDVVFLARDRLRVHDALASGDERTREMAWALQEGKRLAVFDGNGANGIELTCGQHIVTKVGNMHYASTRSMVPVLRNCYVYFEVTVMPRPPNDLTIQAAPVTLSIGLSTVEMPPNTLVGSWQGSVGICTNGQMLVAGQWSSPFDPAMSAYGYSSTVGCLVFLDDSTAFETWDGVMVNASVTFTINGELVPPPVSTPPLPGAMEALLNHASRPNPIPQDDSHFVQGIDSLCSSFTTPTLLVPASEELYPTVTLQTPATAVMCRFSSEDVIYRDIVGAPPDVTVYAVDGSVISNGSAVNTASVRSPLV